MHANNRLSSVVGVDTKLPCQMTQGQVDGRPFHKEKGFGFCTCLGLNQRVFGTKQHLWILSLFFHCIQSQWVESNRNQGPVADLVLFYCQLTSGWLRGWACCREPFDTITQLLHCGQRSLHSARVTIYTALGSKLSRNTNSRHVIGDVKISFHSVEH